MMVVQSETQSDLGDQSAACCIFDFRADSFSALHFMVSPVMIAVSYIAIKLKSEKTALQAPDPFLRHSSINAFYPLFPFR